MNDTPASTTIAPQVLLIVSANLTPSNILAKNHSK